jgi:hypothetical protein
MSIARRAAALGSTGLVAAVLVVTVLVVTGALVAAGGAASAASFIKARYKVTGTTFLAGPNTSVSLGPGTLSAKVNGSTGKLTATLSMPPATASFKELNLIQVTATTKFINDGPTTGKVNLNTGATRTTSKITLQITNLTVAGQSIAVGSRCETSSPVVINLKSKKGFNPLNGGKVAGSYTIGKFSHCGLATLAINQTVPASGNTITLKLGKAKIG